MSKVLVLGANGQIARIAVDLFLKTTKDVALTLYLRNAKRLRHSDAPGVRVVEGDVLDTKRLSDAMAGQDVVYANLDGELESQAHSIVTAMHAANVRRLIFVSSMGIYDEVPGEKFGSVLDPYRHSVAVIEASDLDYTIVRPAWLNDADEIAYATTEKGEAFRGSVVSRKSVAALVVELATGRRAASRRSLGIGKA